MHWKRFWPAAFAVALVPASEAEGQSLNAKCRPATVELTSPWRPAKVPEYVASFGDITPDFEVEPDERWKQLGEHRTDAILDVDTEVETRCDPNTCRTCVTTISARIGFTPSVIRLHEELRRNRCARKLTMLHERQHEAVTRKAQEMALREAKRNLRWATYPHAAHVTRASGREAGQEEIMRRSAKTLRGPWRKPWRMRMRRTPASTGRSDTGARVGSDGECAATDSGVRAERNRRPSRWFVVGSPVNGGEKTIPSVFLLVGPAGLEPATNGL